MHQHWTKGLLIALGLVGCHGAAPAQPVSNDSCARLGKQVCERAGEEDSDVCEALEEALPLFTEPACALALRDPTALQARLDTRKQRCSGLAARLCQDLGAETRQCKNVREMTRKFSPERCTRMLHAYGEVLDNLHAQVAQHQLSPAQTAELGVGDPPSSGPPMAALQLVEFVDFENHDCVKAAGIVRELLTKYGSALRVVVRQMPLAYNAHAKLAAEAALAAHAQGKFWPYHDELLAHQSALGRAELEGYARAVALDLKAFRAALDAHRFAALVEADLALSQKLAITGMPTMFLNGERLLNAVDKDGVVEATEEKLSITTKP